MPESLNQKIIITCNNCKENSKSSQTFMFSNQMKESIEDKLKDIIENIDEYSSILIEKENAIDTDTIFKPVSNKYFCFIDEEKFMDQYCKNGKSSKINGHFAENNIIVNGINLSFQLQPNKSYPVITPYVAHYNLSKHKISVAEFDNKMSDWVEIYSRVLPPESKQEFQNNMNLINDNFEHQGFNPQVAYKLLLDLMESEIYNFVKLYGGI